MLKYPLYMWSVLLFIQEWLTKYWHQVPGKWHNSMKVTIATCTVNGKHVHIVNQALPKSLL